MSKAVIEDFEQVLGILNRKGIPHPVIEDKHIDLGKAAQQGMVRTILAGLGQEMEQTGSAKIAHRVTVANGSVAKGTGEISFSTASWAEDK